MVEILNSEKEFYSRGRASRGGRIEKSPLKWFSFVIVIMRHGDTIFRRRSRRKPLWWRRRRTRPRSTSPQHDHFERNLKLNWCCCCWGCYCSLTGHERCLTAAVFTHTLSLSLFRFSIRERASERATPLRDSFYKHIFNPQLQLYGPQRSIHLYQHLEHTWVRFPPLISFKSRWYTPSKETKYSGLLLIEEKR